MEEATDTTDLKADVLGLAGNADDAGGKRVLGTDAWRPHVLAMDIVRDRDDNAPFRESPCRDEKISVHCVATTTATTAAVEKKSRANGDLDSRRLKRARVRDNVLIQVYNSSHRHRHTDLCSSLSNLQRSLHGFSVVSRRVVLFYLSCKNLLAVVVIFHNETNIRMNARALRQLKTS